MPASLCLIAMFRVLSVNPAGEGSRQDQPNKHPASSSTTTLGDGFNWRKGER